MTRANIREMKCKLHQKVSHGKIWGMMNKDFLEAKYISRHPKTVSRH